MREKIVVINRIEVAGQQDLPHIVQVDRHLGAVLGPAESGQDQAGEDRDNGDDDQQLDQRECGS